MNRILVIGSAGSGKSTLSRKLSTILKLPAIHLDRYYWKPNWVATPNDEWDTIVEKFSAQEQWIMDCGVKPLSLDMGMQAAIIETPSLDT